MTDKTKKIIAREGLVILGIIALSTFLNFISYKFPPLPKEAHGNYLVSTEGDKYYIIPIGNPADNSSDWVDIKDASILEKNKGNTIEVTNIVRWQNKIRAMGFIILFSGYPFYLIIRFIIWAVKTLKENKRK